MIGELVHAWSDQGLDGDGPGYVTVARTPGLPASASRIAEACSGHRVGIDDRSTMALRRFETVEGVFVVLSATSPVRRDSDPARIATHLILDEDSAARHDPAAILAAWRPRLEWREDPRELPPPRFSEDPTESRPCETWLRAAGDAGWAGDVVERLRRLEGSTLVVRLAGEIEAAAMLRELLALLPAEERRRFTFADRLRRRDEVSLVLLDDQAAAIAEAPLPGGAALLDLTGRLPASSGELANAARSGSVASPAAPRDMPDVGIIEPERIEDSDRVWSGPIEVRLATPTPSRLTSSLALVAVLAAVAVAVGWVLWSRFGGSTEVSP